MLYIEYSNGTLGELRAPRRFETKLSDGTYLGRPETGWTNVQLAACGLFPVAKVDKPDDTATATHTRTVELGTPGDPTTATVVWDERRFTKQDRDEKALAAKASDDDTALWAKAADIAAGKGMTTNATMKAAIQDLAQLITKDHI